MSRTRVICSEEYVKDLHRRKNTLCSDMTKLQKALKEKQSELKKVCKQIAKLNQPSFLEED